MFYLFIVLAIPVLAHFLWILQCPVSRYIWGAIRERTGGLELYYIYYWVNIHPSYLNCLNITLHSITLHS